MRRLALLVTVGLLWAEPAAAQSWGNKILGGTQETPLVLDFGTVAKGTQLQRTFQMKNIYKVPLQITDIRVSCGCVVAEPSSKNLAPGDVANLVVKMDAGRFDGQKTVNVHVTFGPGPQYISTASILVNANARQDVTLNPGAIDFGAIQRGQAITRSLDIECAGKPQWKVLGATVGPNAPFTVKIEALPGRIVKGFNLVGYRVVATMNPNVRLDAFNETIDLQTNDPAQPKVSFQASGIVSAPLAAAPNPIMPVGLKVGGGQNSVLVVSAGQPFRIINIQGVGPDVKVAIPNGPAANQHILQVQIMPNAPGALNRELIIQTDLRGETIRVPVRGNVNP